MKLLTMIQKLAFGILGVLLLASPIVASADTVSDIQAKIQSILAKLQQLQTERAIVSSQSFTALPTSGFAPLSVVFQQRTVPDAGAFAVDFGDGTGFGAMTCAPLTGSNDSLCRVTHAYTMPGVYSAELIGKGLGNSSEWQGTGKRAMFTVRNSVGGASATIDQHSLLANSANPTITGTVWNADIGVWIKKGRVTVPSPIGTNPQDYVWRSPNGFPVVGGRWSAQVAGPGIKLENGIYTIVVSDQKTAFVLMTGTLFVDTSR